MPFILKYIKLFAAAAGVLAFIGAMMWAHHRGVVSCETSHLEQSVEGEKLHAKIKNQVISLPDAGLDKRLARWLRE